MPRPRVAMRKIRDVLRLAFGEGLSRRQVSASLGIPFTTVSDHVRRAKAAGLSLAAARRARRRTPSSALLFPPPAPSQRRPARCRTGRTSTRELRKKGVTLQLLWLEYREAHPDGYGYSQFCHHYRALAPTRRRRHAPGAPGRARSSSSTSPARRSPSTTDRTGEVAFEAELFVAVLGASSYLYAEALRLPGAPATG